MPINATTTQSKRDYWILEMSHIHASHRANEARFQSQRWFDYKRMTGAEATYLFADNYSLEYQDCYKRTRDIRTVDAVTPFSPDDVFQSSDLTSMWLARQGADSIGCKYTFYLNHIFEVFASRGWKNLPRPNQLYSEELVISVNTAWNHRCMVILQLAEQPFFFAESYVGHPDQVAYYDYLISSINKRESKHYALSSVLRKKILPTELAIEAFGQDTYKKALLI